MMVRRQELFLAKSVVIEVRLYVKMVNYNRNSGLCIIYGGLEKDNVRYKYNSFFR